MKHTARLARTACLLSIVLLAALPRQGGWGQVQPAAPAAKSNAPSAEALAAERKRQASHEFQSQELMLARSGTWIFKPGETPRILWRDMETVRRLGCDGRLRVRWFDAKLNESPEPNAPGRWLAWIEGTAPNGTPLRRSLTF